MDVHTFRMTSLRRPAATLASLDEQRCDCGPVRRTVGRPAVPRPVTPAAPGQGRRLADRDRADDRRPRPARDRRPGLALRPLAADQGRAGALHGRRTDVPDGSDAARRALLLRHPPRRVPRPRRVLADRHRLCRGRVHEQLPPREHRHVRDPADVRRHHPGVHVRRRDRRVPRAEDFLHGRRDVRLPLPLPVRAGVVRPQPWQPLEASRRVDRDRRGGRDAARDRRPDLLAPGQEALAPGQAGRGDPRPSEAVLHPCVPSLPRRRGSAS